MDITEEKVLEIIESNNVYNIQSFDKSTYTDDDVELYETVGQEDKTFEKIENRDFLKKSIDKFNEAEKEFIQMRYFGNMTQKDIAKKFGVSQMYISRLEKKVLERFRRILN